MWRSRERSSRRCSSAGPPPCGQSWRGSPPRLRLPLGLRPATHEVAKPVVAVRDIEPNRDSAGGEGPGLRAVDTEQHLDWRARAALEAGLEEPQVVRGEGESGVR